jgi:exonuclease SbcC
MIPIRLKIEGFLSYRNPVELDFTGFDLACISGQNGAGKSALLDAITWALFGYARKRDESIINNNPKVDAAEVTLDFDYEGNRYRVMRTNPRGKTSSVEFFILSNIPGEEGRWKTLTERTLRETDKKIENTLRMDFETFTNASFFLQGKADQFATSRPGDRKRILSNILGLEIWETYRENANQRRREVEKDVKALDGRLTEIQAELDEGPERKKRLAELEERLENLVAQRESQAKILENVKRIHTSLVEQRKILDNLRTQLERLKRDHNRILETLDKRQKEKSDHLQTLAEEDAVESAHQNWQKSRTELSSMEELAEAYRKHEALRQEPLKIIHAKEARLLQEKQTLEAQKSEMTHALSEVESLQSQITVAQTAIEKAQEKIARREALEEEIRQHQGKFAEAKAENPRLADEGKALANRIDQLKGTEEAECPVCGQPLSKEEREILVGELSEDLESMRERYRINSELVRNYETELQKMGSELADLKNSDQELREANQKLDQINNRLSVLEENRKTWESKGAPRLEEINEVLANQTFATEAREQLDAIKADLEALGYDLEAHEKLRQSEKEGRKAEQALLKIKQARAALIPIEREITDLSEQEIEKAKELAEQTNTYDEAAVKLAASEVDLPDLEQAESDLYDIREKENILRSEVGGAEQKVRALKQQKERKDQLLEERENLTQRISDLKQLERAFGKDGIPALLIEQALPEIEENANNLLSRLTNGRMALRFETQREYKDTSREDQKETLDLVISDSVGVRDYEMYSGGEAFRVNFAIRLALSEVLARRAGARLQTLVIDEGFGSQDALGRQRLVEAINLVRDDFEKILVITHLEELKEAFPTRIEVEKTPEGSVIQII